MATIYDKQAFALQYPNGSLVAIDRDSGGYPYEATDIREVWVTYDKYALEQYRKTGNEGLTVVPIVITVTIG